MLVNVYLDGALGKQFGKKWQLQAKTPGQVLALIQANTGTLFSWMRANLEKYANYRVLATFKNGNREYLSQDTVISAHDIVSIRFTPVIKGAGNVAKVITGAVLIAVGIYFGNPYVIQAGVALALNGVSGMLAPKQKTGSQNTSHYFQGVGKNQMQGNPVPLIYGRCKVDGIPIAKKLSVDEQSMFKKTNGIKGYLNGSGSSSAIRSENY